MNNKCQAPIKLRFQKICEIEGEMKPKPEEKLPEDPNDPKGKKGKKDKGKDTKKGKESKKGKDKGKKKIQKFSKILTDDEVYSIENFFDQKSDESYFELVAEKDTVSILPMSKSKINIRFGLPLTPEEREVLLSGKKGKKSSEKSSKSSKSSKKGKPKGPQKFYVAKYNILLGTSTFFRDIIIVATFV